MAVDLSPLFPTQYPALVNSGSATDSYIIGGCIIFFLFWFFYNLRKAFNATTMGP